MKDLGKCVETLYHNTMFLRLIVFHDSKAGYFLIYYCFQHWLRLNCMEVFHYVADNLFVYSLFENRNKDIKINKEGGEVYNDFNFNSTEFLSECTNNITHSQTSVQDATDNVFSFNLDALIPQMSIDHSVLEEDINSEPAPYNLNKVHSLATGGFKDIDRR